MAIWSSSSPSSNPVPVSGSTVEIRVAMMSSLGVGSPRRTAASRRLIGASRIWRITLAAALARQWPGSSRVGTLASFSIPWA